MSDQNGNEMDRILRLVEDGKVSPAEGERLIASLESRRQTLRCPYCAESIQVGAAVCPECASPLARPTFEPAGSAEQRDGYTRLTALGKVLVIYTFVITGIVLLTGLRLPWSWSLVDVTRSGLAVLGMAGAVLICKGHRGGWVLGMFWAGLQVVELVVGGHVLNRQVLAVDFIFTSNGNGLGVNILAILLLVLFVVASKAHRKPGTAMRPERYVREVVR
jgi:hypothetical protein